MERIAEKIEEMAHLLTVLGVWLDRVHGKKENTPR